MESSIWLFAQQRIIMSHLQQFTALKAQQHVQLPHKLNIPMFSSLVGKISTTALFYLEEELFNLDE